MFRPHISPYSPAAYDAVFRHTLPGSGDGPVGAQQPSAATSPNSRPSAVKVAPPLAAAKGAAAQDHKAAGPRPSGDVAIDVAPDTVDSVLGRFGIAPDTPGLAWVGHPNGRYLEPGRSDPAAFVGGLKNLELDLQWLKDMLEELDSQFPPLKADAPAEARRARAERLVKTAIVLKVMNVESRQKLRELINEGRTRDFARQIGVALLTYFLSFGAASFVSGMARDSKDGGKTPPGWLLTNPYEAFVAACGVLGIGGEFAHAIIRQGELGPTYNQPAAPHPALFTLTTAPFTIAHAIADMMGKGNLTLVRIGSGAVGALFTGVLQATLSYCAATSDPVFLDGRGAKGGRMMHDIVALQENRCAALGNFLSTNLVDGVRETVAWPGLDAVVRAVFRAGLGGTTQLGRVDGLLEREHARQANAITDGVLGLWAGLHKHIVLGAPSMFVRPAAAPAPTPRELQGGKKLVQDFTVYGGAVGWASAEPDVVVDIRGPGLSLEEREGKHSASKDKRRPYVGATPSSVAPATPASRWTDSSPMSASQGGHLSLVSTPSAIFEHADDSDSATPLGQAHGEDEISAGDFLTPCRPRTENGAGPAPGLMVPSTDDTEG